MRLLALLSAGRTTEVLKTQHERDVDAVWREATRSQEDAYREAIERILAQAKGLPR